MPGRTQPEVVARLRKIRADAADLSLFVEEALLPALDFDHARPFLPPSVRRTRWRQRTDHELHARGYLVFAISRIIDHRWDAARRCVVNLAELAWLLDRDDVVTAMGAAGFHRYGAPKVKAFADGFGWRFVDSVEDLKSREALNRMAHGLQCRPDGCPWGCAD